jgi:mRNA interferase RelE/StbE
MLLENPKPQDSLTLKGYSDYYRIDVGEYRVIYSFSAKWVKIAVVGKRNDDEVYKKFERINPKNQ